MHKKRILALCAAVGVTASLVAGCGQEDKKAPVDTGSQAVEQTVENTTSVDTTPTVENATEATVPESVENTEAFDNTETNTDNTETNTDNDDPATVADDMINSGLKSPVENPDGSVTLYAEIVEDLGDGIMLVETVNGPFEITISDSTLVAGDGKLEAGEFIEFISDGVVTMSLPGQIPNIFSIVEITEEMAMENPVITDTVAAHLPAIERTEAGDSAKYYAQIKSLIGTEQMLVVTNEGEKLINVNEALIAGNEYSTGDFIVFYSDGVESRSIPAQITSVNLIEYMDETMAKQAQAAIDREVPVNDSDINSLPTEETVEFETTEIEEVDNSSDSGSDSEEVDDTESTEAAGA